MKIYISGPMAGMRDLNFPAFNKAEVFLDRLGHVIINPASLGQNKNWVWSDYLKRDLIALMPCDTLVLLPGWSRSKGALLELVVAKCLGFEIHTLGRFQRKGEGDVLWREILFNFLTVYGDE